MNISNRISYTYKDNVYPKRKCNTLPYLVKRNHSNIRNRRKKITVTY